MQFFFLNRVVEIRKKWAPPRQLHSSAPQARGVKATVYCF